jgi:hypothetical protein
MAETQDEVLRLLVTGVKSHLVHSACQKTPLELKAQQK